MKTFRKRALTVAVTALVAGVMSAPAHAYVMASAVVKMTDFSIKNSAGTILDASDFSYLTFTSSADQSVDLNGVKLSNAGSSSDSPIDFAPLCVGAACSPITPNNTFPLLSAPPATGNYVAADQQEAGSPISGVPGYSGPATVADGSYVGLDQGVYADGSANSNNNLNASYIFKLDHAGAITFDFDAAAYLQVAVSGFPTETYPAYATASYQMEFSIVNLSTGADVWSFAPDVLGNNVRTLSLNAALPQDVELIRDSGVKAFASTTPVLAADTLYQLSARIQTNADAARVPEPAVLSLLGLGLGLLGLGAARRSRKA